MTPEGCPGCPSCPCDLQLFYFLPHPEDHSSDRKKPGQPGHKKNKKKYNRLDSLDSLDTPPCEVVV